MVEHLLYVNAGFHLSLRIPIATVKLCVGVMSSQWKQTERDVAKVVGGKRYPANQGDRVDVESPIYVVQVKERKSLSLEILTQLVEEMELIGKSRGKLGLVAVKVRRGRGKVSPLLIVQSAKQWSEIDK